ncbi:protein AF-9 isoform X2 [Phlebotomus papatasi]|uniref:protein AF-9 isoform X2 n=1 Tax=Phlebotomus papatasi TaxID=29031 RepID=UPI002484175F|nr:protein AF-9 isoform X2 [Phlebotomus papatasi]
MSVKVLFEIGHDSSLKPKPTPEGFTHDWELFVRGCDNHDISHFVDKVVFNLHESFPKPKRVIKEPPYSVKESGYAGFVLSIDIYVKNREEPKKITFSYDLDLQSTGPMIQRKQSEKYIFTNPSEEFRRKLLKGGGVLLANTTSNLDDKSRDFEERAKGKMSAIGVNDTVKKHKMRPEDPFTNLFGTPITKSSTKVSPDPKSKASPNRISKPPQPQIGGKSAGEKAPGAKEKGDKESKSKHSKHSSPYREKSSDAKESRKGEEKYEKREEKKKDKNHSKDRDKSKEKSVKRPTSPKRSPKRPSPSRSSSASKTEDKSQVPPVVANEKSGSSKKMKKEKKEKSHEKDRDRKEHKKDTVSAEKVTTTKAVSEKSDLGKSVKEVSQGPKELNVREKLKDIIKTPPEITVTAEVPKAQTQERRVEKHEKESERKHKHKKKDKSGSSKEKKKDKGGSSSKSRDDVNSTPTKSSSKASQESAKPHPAFTGQDTGKKTTTPLDKLYNELGEGGTSDSDMDSPTSEKTDVTATGIHENSNSSAQDVTAPKPEEIKSTKKRGEKKSSAEKKKKRNREDGSENPNTTGGKDSPAISKMDPPTKIPRRSGDDLYKNGDAGTPNFPGTPADEGSSYRSGSATSGGSISSTGANPPLSMDYMSELKDLQHKIMTLQDNNELQQVVEMIAATGQYEITSKTFDFDLCALDKDTVQRLQEFFATS